MDRKWIRYLRGDLLEDLAAGHTVTSTVYVECSESYRANGPEALRPVGEVESVVAQQVPAGIMGGIVARADLALGPAIGRVLDAYVAAAGDRLRGLRYSTAWDAQCDNGGRTPGMLHDDRVRAGISVLGRSGLPLDCWLYAHQSDDLRAAAHAFPEQLFILNHLGMPLVGPADPVRRADVLADWRRRMRQLAACPNVRLKVGGLAMHIMGAPWTADAAPSSQQIADFWRAGVEWCIEAFGPARCMFESNFPIDGMVVDYVTLWNAHKRLAAPYSASERAALLHGTAVSSYRLSL